MPNEKEIIEQKCLTKAVCQVLSDKIPEKDVKEHMPDIELIIETLRKDELFQSVIKDLIADKKEEE
jgi:hypothetical protein